MGHPIVRTLVLLVCLLAPLRVDAAIARVQVTKGAVQGTPTASVSTANFPASVTSGNLIVVGVRADLTSLSPTVSDTLGSTYTGRTNYNATNPTLFVFDTVLGSSGTNAVTVNFGGSSPSFSWAFAIEISGQSASPFDTGVAQHVGLSTDLQSPAITTAQAAEYVVMFGSQDNFATYTAANDSAGNSWTLIDGAIGVSSNFGGAEEFITSSALSGVTVHMTSNTTANYTTVTVAYKQASGGGAVTPCRLLLLGVGC